MFRYILRRSLTYLVMVFLTTTMGYFAAVTTLKPALLEQEKVPRPSPEQVNRTLTSLGLDPEMSAWDRYIQWLTNVVTKFDWGRSPNSAYINQEFGQRLWVSTRLMLAATILTIIIGVALGRLLGSASVQVFRPGYYRLFLSRLHYSRPRGIPSWCSREQPPLTTLWLKTAVKRFSM